MNKGILAGIGAYTLWGLFPIYWKLLEQDPAIEILAHRMVWSLVFVAVILTLKREWRWLGEALHNRRTVVTYTLAAILLSLNWYTYIWAVNAGYVVEASLGYFINPLVNFLLGVIFLGEKLRGGQVTAVDPGWVWGGLPDGELRLTTMDLVDVGIHLWHVRLD